MMAAARVHAGNMARRQRGGHVLENAPPEARRPEDRLQHAGWRGFTWGENVYWGPFQPREIVSAWMGSEGHRRNLLGADYREIGVGAASSGGVTYTCAVFGASREGGIPLREDSRRNTPAGENAWRYRFHQGRWWYWLPEKRWAVWMDGRWVRLAN